MQLASVPLPCSVNLATPWWVVGSLQIICSWKYGAGSLEKHTQPQARGCPRGGCCLRLPWCHSLVAGFFEKGATKRRLHLHVCRNRPARLELMRFVNGANAPGSPWVVFFLVVVGAGRLCADGCCRYSRAPIRNPTISQGSILGGP